MKIFKLTTLLILLISLFSCVTTDDDVTFFVNKDKNIKYFFPSRSWDSDANVNFEADWLYRDYPIEDEEESRTILNFTLSSNKIIFRGTPNSIVISTEGYTIAIPENQIRQVYLDKGKSRYSAWLLSDDMVSLMEQTNGDITIKFDLNSNYIFYSPKSFFSHISYFREVLLGLPPIKR